MISVYFQMHRLSLVFYYDVMQSLAMWIAVEFFQLQATLGSDKNSNNGQWKW